MFSKIRILLCFTIVFSFIGNAFAEEFYYRSNKYQCKDDDNNEYVTWGRLTTQGDTISIALQWLPEREKYFVGYYHTSTIKKSDITNGAITINTGSALRTAEINIKNLDNLGSQQPLIVDPSGYVACGKEITLKPITEPVSKIYQNEIDTLNKRPITSNQYFLAIEKWWQSPPAYFLPELEQKTMKANHRTAWDNFYAEYPTAMRKQFKQPNISEKDAEKIFNDVLTTRQQTGNDRFQNALRDTIDSMVRYWAVLHRDTPEKAKKFAVKNADELCASEALLTYYPSDQEQLRWVTRLPIPLWSKEYTNDILQWTKGCKHNITKQIKEEWDSIEKQIKLYPEFVEELNKRLSQPADIATLQAQYWSPFIWTPEDKFKEISNDLQATVAYNFLQPYLLTFLPQLEKDFTDEMSKITDFNEYLEYCTTTVGSEGSEFRKQAYKICKQVNDSLYPKKSTVTAMVWIIQAKQQLGNNLSNADKLNKFCTQKAEKIDYDFREDMESKCSSLLSKELVNMGKIVITDVKKQLQEVPSNIEGIKTLMELSQQLQLKSSYYYSDTLKNTFSRLEKLYQPTLDTINDKYQEIDTAMSSSLAKEYQSVLDREENSDEIDTKIKEVTDKYNAFDNQNYDIKKHLETYEKSLNQMKEKLLCHKIWLGSDFPSDYANKKLNDNSLETYTLKDSFCLLSKQLNGGSTTFGMDKSGIFSTTYSLFVTSHIGDDEEFTVSVDLVEDDDNDNVLNVDNFKTSVGFPDLDDVESAQRHNQLISCLTYPRSCITTKLF